MKCNNGKYALMTVTSMGLRLIPTDRQPVHTSDTFVLTSTSAESNVLNVSASLGLPVKVLALAHKKDGHILPPVRSVFFHTPSFL